MSNIYIIGAGGFAREIYSYMQETEFKYNGYTLAGFLSDDTADLSGFNCEHTVLGPFRNPDFKTKRCSNYGNCKL